MKYRPGQEVTWHNNTENGIVVGWKNTRNKNIYRQTITIKWEGAGVIVYNVQTAELYIK